MTKCFKKIACFTDIHFGKKGDSPEHNQHCIEFIRWFLSVAAEKGCDSICFLGDWHDARNKIGVVTLNASEEGIRLLAASGLNVYFIIGNHDLFFRENRTIHSLPFISLHDNITAITDPIKIGDTAFVPWVVDGDDTVSLVAGAKYVFGHFEFGGFLMNEMFEMPDREGHLRAQDLDVGPEYIFSGHFHKRQVKKLKSGAEVHYIGNTFPHDFTDEGDLNRGMMILEHGKEPEYIEWPNMPAYIRVNASELGDVVPHLSDRTVVRAIQDFDMSKEEREQVSETITSMGVKFTFEPKKEQKDQEAGWTTDVVDVSGIVVDWIRNGEIKAEYDRDLLEKLFLAL